MECSRCGKDSRLKTRGERFCNDCFISFVNIKFRKHMDIYRVNFMAKQLPNLLVPVSFGAGSLALVDMVGQLLAYQRSKHGGRTGLTAQCVYVGDDWPTWPFGDDLPLARINKSQAYDKMVSLNGEPLADGVTGLSRTSQQDLDACLRSLLVSEIAEQLKCTRTLLGCNMTRLSELVISETVKGRGANLPELVNSTDTVLFPLCDITSQEVHMYLQVRRLEQYIRTDPVPPAVTKMQSIDELVHSYFASVQREFPAVVSTVAKTASKLAQPPEPCEICGTGEGECYGCKVMLSGRTGSKKLRLHTLDNVLADYCL